ncbi:hypothetical protein MUG91_G5660n1 [Manis pentadactyla]|nr:hypothetical protein MUG91_G5660n1 [Manis pentadactyla]
MDLKHRQDDSGDVLLMIVKLTTRVTGGIQTADGDGDSCVLDLLPLGRRRLQPYESLRHRQVDSGDVLLMIALPREGDHVILRFDIVLSWQVRKALAAVWISQASSDDSGDVLLMIDLRAMIESLAEGLEGACSRMDLSKHCQDDSGDVLLMIVMLIKTRVSGALQTCDGVKLTMTRVTGGIQTADGDGDSCVLDILPLGQEDACSRMNLQASLKLTSGDVLPMILLLGVEIHVLSCFLEFRKALAAVWISSGILKMTLVICCSRCQEGAWQPYGSLKHRQDDSVMCCS